MDADEVDDGGGVTDDDDGGGSAADDRRVDGEGDVLGAAVPALARLIEGDVDISECDGADDPLTECADDESSSSLLLREIGRAADDVGGDRPVDAACANTSVATVARRRLPSNELLLPDALGGGDSLTPAPAPAPPPLPLPGLAGVMSANVPLFGPRLRKPDSKPRNVDVPDSLGVRA